MKKYLLPIVCAVLFSCSADLDDNLTREKIDGVPDYIEVIEREDALYSYLGLVSQDPETEVTEVGCIEFIYPFTLFQFNDEDEYVQQVSVQGNENFADILSGLQEDWSIGLSYPISGNLIDGTPVSVTSNEELQASMETCIEEELEIIIGDCEAIMEDCVWKVAQSDPQESPYIGSFFTMRSDGSTVFSVLQKNQEIDGAEDEDGHSEEGNTDEGEGDDNEGETDENDPEETDEFEEETGTWIFYFIGADLHLNINFGPIEDDEETDDPETYALKTDWNFDWKINYIDFEKIEIERTYTEIVETDEGEVEEEVTEKFTLKKECETSEL